MAQWLRCCATDLEFVLYWLWGNAVAQCDTVVKVLCYGFRVRIVLALGDRGGTVWHSVTQWLRCCATDLEFVLFWLWGTAVAQWIRCCATDLEFVLYWLDT